MQHTYIHVGVMKGNRIKHNNLLLLYPAPSMDINNAAISIADRKMAIIDQSKNEKVNRGQQNKVPAKRKLCMGVLHHQC